jgi:hypothetical protein
MALTKLGALVQDIRGSQNGLTFSRNKGGSYVRAKVSPTQPRTAAQLAVRANLATSSKNWSGQLSAAERSAWAGFASANTKTNVFGDTTHISGFQWFMGLNQVLKQINSTTITSPPSDLSVGSNLTPESVDMETSPPYATLSFNAGTVDANTDAYIFATPSLQQGITPGESLYRYIGTTTLTTSTIAQSVNISDLYFPKFGAPIAGKSVWFLISNVNTQTGATTVGQKIVGQV